MPSLHFILQQYIPNMLFSDDEENITNTTHAPVKVVAVVFSWEGLKYMYCSVTMSVYPYLNRSVSFSLNTEIVQEC